MGFILGLAMGKIIEYRRCEKCNQLYTTDRKSKINRCFHCWRYER